MRRNETLQVMLTADEKALLKRACGLVPGLPLSEWVRQRIIASACAETGGTHSEAVPVLDLKPRATVIR